MLIGIIPPLIFLICLLPGASSADLCSWVDKAGVRHFSNTNNCPRGEGKISPESENGDAQADRNRSGLRFMGLYRDGAHHLRFYADGTVVSATVSGSGQPEKLATWFGKSAKKIYKGAYSIDDENIVRFYTLHEQNLVLAKGIVNEDVLNVAFFHVVKKHLNEHNYVKYALRSYAFIPVDFPRENRY